MQLSRTRIVAGVAATTLSLAFLAGCGEDEPQPKFEDPTSASPSKSASPEEPVEPTPPAAMEGDDVAGAKAFVEYYFDQLTYGVLSGRTKGLESLALADCGGCRGALNAARTIHQKGGTVRGGEMRASGIRLAQKETPTSSFRAFGGRLRLDISEQVIRGTGVQSLDGRSEASSIAIQIQVVHSSNGWQVAEWSQL